MSVRPELRLTGRQRLALTPAMRQSLWLLRLPAAELGEEIARIADENPFVEIRRPAARPQPAEGWEEPAARESLFLSLQKQLAALHLPQDVLRAAFYLVSELREDGYLDAALAELSTESGLAPDLLDRALAALQRCEPAGIGARDLAECLALQLQAAGHAPAEARAVAAHLDDFAEERWPRLSAALGLPRPALERIAARLRALPAAPLAPEDEPVRWRLPDLLLSFGSDARPRVVLNPEALPVVTAAARMQGASPEAAEARAEAARLVAALSARGRTLLRVGAHLAEAQIRHFASGGHEPLLPMTRQAAAEALAMHPATFGRAIAGKSLAIAGRIYPLAEYYSHALHGRDGEISAHEVQRRIRALIAAEPAGTPLADAAIAAHLQREGVDIARRTVAKYRKWMRIASSFERRRRNLSGT